MKKIAVSTLSVVALTLMSPQAADACGGLFCNAQQPVVQTGEGIVFAVDTAAGTVDAVINIRYQGEAADFAWILPLQSPPDALEVAPAFLFATSDRLTAPVFQPTFETTGICNDRSLSFPNLNLAGAADAAPMAAGKGVEVIAQKAVGPYESVVLQGTDPEAVRTWLEMNEYNVTDEMMEAVTPYLAQGDTLLALRLQNSRGVSDIQPIWVKMQGTEACVPIRLTAIAALDDMDITTLVLSNEGRAIPDNYYHVTLNLARIDWLTRGSNYRQVVADAADEGEGNAFTTEFSGSARVFDQQLYTPSQYSRVAIEGVDDAADLLNALLNQTLIVHPEVVSILENQIGAEALASRGIASGDLQQCVFCYDLSGLPVDGAAAAEEIWSRIIQPLEQLQSMFNRYDHLTRLYTLISPEEMNVDPIFSFRSDLADVSNVHTARVIRDCGVGGTGNDGDIEVVIDETGQSIRFPNAGSGMPPDRTILDSMPAAVKVEQLALGTVVKDQSAEIDRLLDEQNGACACSSVHPRGPAGWIVAGLILSLLGLRRRRR